MIETPDTKATQERTGRPRRYRGIAAGIAAGIVVAGIGIPVAASAVPQPTPPAAAHRAAAEPGASLGDVTLDRLAAELADLGLALEITPAGNAGPATGVGEDTAAATDPFAGMTDAEIDALSDAEFSALIQQSGWDSDDTAAPDDGENTAADPSEAPIGTFTVDGDRIVTGDAESAVAADARAIWQRFVELIPADQRGMVVGFELLDESVGGAYVYPTDEDPTKWVLGVSRGLGSDLDGVLIHEFGHLLTLQAREVPPGGDGESCSTYFTGEGCALSGSTFARFVERFWPQSMIDEVNAIQETADFDAADSFWQRHQDDFVTDYATTNPGEDLAETFAVFVMNDKPSGDTIADRKVQFLWEDPAMVALRDQIRSNMTQLAPVG